MGTGIDCEVCGNEIDLTASACPFCGAQRTKLPDRGSGRQHKVINLERGMPLVEQAIHRLTREIETSRRQGYRVLTLIHGYGSSGKGGAIKAEVRRQLRYLRDKGKINDMLAGEDFYKGVGHGHQLLKRFPFLSTHSDLNRANQGITLVVL